MNALASRVPVTLRPIAETKLSLSLLLKHQCHLGAHNMHAANIATTYGTRNGLNIINLTHTLSSLRLAASVAKEVVKRDGIVLIVGPKRAHARIVDTAERTGQFYALQWRTGTLTDSKLLPSDAPLPDLLVVLDVKANMQAVKEATIANIPVIGIVDSDADPSAVLYPVCCNDDSLSSVSLVLGVLERAMLDGLAARQ